MGRHFLHTAVKIVQNRRPVCVIPIFVVTVRIDNTIKDMPRLLSTSQGQLQNLQEQVELTKAELGKPFPQEAELAQKSQRLAELNSILDMDGKNNNSERDSEDRDDTDRPSVLDDLHRRVEEMPPHRRTESRGLEERA